METTVKWEAFKDLDVPCADIFYEWKWRELVVLMQFSRVIGGCPHDLRLTFTCPLALQWEDESFDFMDLPEPIPRCSDSRFTGWSYPTLVVENSRWAEKYANRKYAEGDPGAKDVTHYVFLAMNDILHVLSDGEPAVALVEPVDEYE